MHSKYNKCTDINTLESLPHGTVVRLEGWILQKYGDSNLSLYDGVGGTIRIARHPKLQEILDSSHNTFSVQVPVLHVKVYHVQDYDYYSWARSHTEIFYYELKPGKCDCGAVYTSFPNQHSSWCNSHIWE